MATGMIDIPRAIRALDRLLEADRASRKLAVLAPIEAPLVKAMRQRFKKQSKRFLAGLGEIRDHFPDGYAEAGRLTEAITGSWEPILDDAAEATAQDAIDALQAAADAGLLAGGSATAASLGLQLTFTLSNPRAVAFLEGRGAAQVAGIDATTRAELAKILAGGLNQGLSYEKIAALIRDEFAGWAGELEPQSFIRDRAELIAVTEVHTAYEEGSLGVARDLAAEGLDMEKQWLTVEDERVDQDCENNADADWIPLGDAFSTGDDAPPAHPACRCLPGGAAVDAGAVVAAYRRWYEGDLIEVRTAAGYKLTATPNHPVFTDQGWVAVEGLQEGDHLISRCLTKPGALDRVPDVERRPPTIGEVFDATAQAGDRYRVAGVGVDFHGDGREGDVDVVVANRQLGRWGIPAAFQPIHDPALAPPNEEQGALRRDGMGAIGGMRQRLSAGEVELTHAHEHGGRQAPPFNPGRHQGSLDDLAGNSHRARQRQLGLAAQVAVEQVAGRLPAVGRSLLGRPSARNSLAVEPSPHRGLGNTETAAESDHALAGQVTPDQVLGIRRFPWSGHVFNLQTETGWYIAEGIVTRNCTCLYRRVGADGQDITTVADEGFGPGE